MGFEGVELDEFGFFGILDVVGVADGFFAFVGEGVDLFLGEDAALL